MIYIPNQLKSFTLLMTFSLLSLLLWVQVNAMDTGFIKFFGNLLTFPLGLVAVIYLEVFSFIANTPVINPEKEVDAVLEHVYAWAGIAALCWSEEILRTAGRVIDRFGVALASLFGRRGRPSQEQIEREELLADLEADRNELERLQIQLKEFEQKRTDD